MLVFCSRGQYDCSQAQNSGECSCREGLGGNCCDVPLSGTTLASVLTTLQSGAGMWSATLPALVAAVALLLLGMRRRRRRRQQQAAEGGGAGSMRDSAMRGGVDLGGDLAEQLREPLLPSAEEPPSGGSAADGGGSGGGAAPRMSHRRSASEPVLFNSPLFRPPSVHDALNLLPDSSAAWGGGSPGMGYSFASEPNLSLGTREAEEARRSPGETLFRQFSSDLMTHDNMLMFDFSRHASTPSDRPGAPLPQARRVPARPPRRPAAAELVETQPRRPPSVHDALNTLTDSSMPLGRSPSAREETPPLFRTP